MTIWTKQVSGYEAAYNAMTYDTDKETLEAAKVYLEGELLAKIKKSSTRQEN